MDLPPLVYPFTGEHLGWFQILATLHIIAINISVKFSHRQKFLAHLDKYEGV